MKKHFAIPLIIFSLIVNSCKKESKKIEKENSGIEFVILGTAENGNGKKIGLYIPSLGMDNRLTSEIINGKFEFKGSLPNPEKATIAFDDELEEYDGMYYSYQIFLTNDTIVMDVEIGEQFNNLLFTKDTILKSDINNYFQKTKNEFWETFNGASISDSRTEMDSLKRNIYPDIRDKVLSSYGKLYSNPEYSLIGLNFLRYILEDKFIFDKSEISQKQKKTINDYFKLIEPRLIGTPDYVVTESLIKKLNDKEFGIGFMDFELLDESNQTTKLSEIIKQNKFTVLDFWWSGCGPCRKFNRNGSKNYNNLNSNGIEIVGVNVDDGISKWKKASLEDSLNWINLYAGANSRIQTDYGISTFPYKIIVDRNFNIIDFDFKEAVELLKLIE